MRPVEDQLNQLEDTLVSEFRLLQNLIQITQKESTTLLKASYSMLMPILEDKEAILDQLGTLENTREKIVEGLAQTFGLDQRPFSMQALMSYCDAERGGRVRRLSEGIVALSQQEKDLNVNVNTLAQSWVEMIHSTQAYLLSFYQTPATYQPPGVRAPNHQPSLWATEHRA
jgi:flagellar biosynthesis/type III secretory pathway chaperone